MEGRRVNEFWPPALESGDYSKVTLEDGSHEWFVRCPDGGITALWINEPDQRGNRHHVVEHEDGTISVTNDEHSPNSILSPLGWHGFIRRGVWEATR